MTYANGFPIFLNDSELYCKVRRSHTRTCPILEILANEMKPAEIIYINRIHPEKKKQYREDLSSQGCLVETEPVSLLEQIERDIQESCQLDAAQAHVNAKD